MKRVFAPVPNYFGGSMKKISAVLLVLVLVGSVAFAGFTGSATTSFGYNLDSGVYGFKNGKAVSVDVNFMELVGEKKTDGNIYVDIAATLNFTFDNADESGLAPAGGLDVATRLNAVAKFKHAKIVGDNWYVGILGSLVAPTFAVSAIDAAGDGGDTNTLGFAIDEDDYFADLAFKGVVPAAAKPAGVEVGVADFVASIGVAGDANNDKYDFYGTLTTPEFEFAEGLTAKFGAAASITDLAMVFGGSVKVAYADDDLAVSVASDVLLNEKDFDADVALAASYTDYSLDVYYATQTNNGVKAGTDNLLSAKVAAAIDPVKITLTGKDLVNLQDLSLSVKFQATDELAVTARGGYVINTEVWNGGADVEYKTDDFTAKAGGTYRSTERISVNASIETETLIPGAVLKLAYAGDDLTAADPVVGGYTNGDMGAVTASVKIAF